MLRHGKQPQLLLKEIKISIFVPIYQELPLFFAYRYNICEMYDQKVVNEFFLLQKFS